MEVSNIITEIDAQIAKLQQARTLLAGYFQRSTKQSSGHRGRLKGSKNIPKPPAVGPKRVLSAEGQARIAAAQKKRHAAKKKAGKKAAAEASEPQAA